MVAFEVVERSRDAWEPTFIVDTSGRKMWNELLSARHDARAHGGEKWKPGYMPDESNTNARGNVGFVDGHIEYLTRREAHDVRRWAPHLAESPDWRER